MSFDLYENENLDAVSSMAPVQDVPAGFFDGFGKVPQLAMRSAAVAGRATSLLASAPRVLLDRIKGDTDLEDRYFKQHEDVFQRAVDYWTPKPNEVGTAAQVVGDMLFTLPTAIAAPPIALGSAYAGTAEDLVRQGVDPAQAQAVGGVQSAGLALGLWMPILGKNLWQRTVVGGAGFNALQGIATRGASEAILSDTEAKDQFHAFDGEALTLDVLMGLGFGTFAHLSPEQRAQGEATWNRISEWAQQMSPSQKAAIATLREAQHLNVDSVPGKPVDPVDVEAHVNRMRQAIDQLVNDQPVQVSDLPEPKLEADPAREAQTQENYRNLADAAEQVRQDEGIPQVSEVGKTITERLMDIGVPPQEAADKGLLLLDSKAKAPQSPPGGDVPPPRVMAGEATAADLDKVLASGEPNLENHKPLSDPDVQGMLQDMALNEAGWAEKGGYLLRSGSEVAGEEVISRTKWIPKAEWWADRPAQGKRRLNEEQVKEAVRKAIAGEPLKPLEQSTVDFMAAIANDRIQGVEQVGPNGWDDAMQWVNRFNEPPTTENVFDYLAMERAIEINPEAANAAMDAYNIHNDDALVMAEFRSIINEKIQQDSQSVSGGAGEGGGEKPAGQPDPIEAEARRIADADPSRTISLGTDANGEPVKMTVAEYLDAAKMEADQARKDVSLIQAAAECLMGNL